MRSSASVHSTAPAAQHTPNPVRPEDARIAGASHVMWCDKPKAPGADARNAVFHGTSRRQVAMWNGRVSAHGATGGARAPRGRRQLWRKRWHQAAHALETSASRHSARGLTCCRLDPVANDPIRTFALIGIEPVVSHFTRPPCHNLLCLRNAHGWVLAVAPERSEFAALIGGRARRPSRKHNSRRC
jgi:hypothetical protein